MAYFNIDPYIQEEAIISALEGLNMSVFVSSTDNEEYPKQLLKSGVVLPYAVVSFSSPARKASDSSLAGVEFDAYWEAVAIKIGGTVEDQVRRMRGRVMNTLAKLNLPEGYKLIMNGGGRFSNPASITVPLIYAYTLYYTYTFNHVVEF